MMQHKDNYGFLPYQTILNFFLSKEHSDENILQAIDMFKIQLKNDGNIGLAKTVHQRVKQQKVKGLGDVFITLGFDEIKEKSGLKDIDVEKFLRVMISKQHLRAKIDGETRTVQFVEDSEMLTLVNSIDLKNRRIVQLVGLVQ